MDFVAAILGLSSREIGPPVLQTVLYLYRTEVQLLNFECSTGGTSSKFCL